MMMKDAMGEYHFYPEWYPVYKNWTIGYAHPPFKPVEMPTRCDCQKTDVVKVWNCQTDPDWDGW